ncbi:hypothetical protein CPB86DRAFT_258903 [Serendipita vermifera]|nr:hypothetical protein CPB86DRAFT_258903 [Serendipita vermifera]
MNNALCPYFHQDNLTQPPDGTDWVVWQGLEFQGNKIINGIDTNHYTTTTQSDGVTAYSFQNIPHPFAPSSPAATSMSAAYPTNSQQARTHPFIPNVPYHYGLPSSWGPLIHHPPSGYSPSVPMQTPTTNSAAVSTSMSPQAAAPSPSQVQRPRFACSICPKTFSSRVRADTCLYKHMDMKPFACNGICGVMGCPKRYASKALLTRHCISFGEKTVLCPTCNHICSKHNIARHRRKYHQ